MYPDSPLFIDGEWIGAEDRSSLPVEDPATRRVIGRVAVATDADLRSAIAAAHRSFDGWRSTSPHTRAAILMRAANMLRSRRGEIA
jgi:succinate-semialdehyde dehydrogenase/glutarate-semialdehyde dehydrogenase